LFRGFDGTRSGTIRGTISDQITKEKLPGANLIIKGTSNGVASDLKGNFLLRNVPSGKQTIVISYIGYVSDTVVVDVPAGGSITKDFALLVTTVEGEEVVITAQAQGQLEAINHSSLAINQ